MERAFLNALQIIEASGHRCGGNAEIACPKAVKEGITKVPKRGGRSSKSSRENLHFRSLKTLIEHVFRAKAQTRSKGSGLSAAAL
jgi:hypothetical protein